MKEVFVHASPLHVFSNNKQVLFPMLEFPNGGKCNVYFQFFFPVIFLLHVFHFRANMLAEAEEMSIVIF